MARADMTEAETGADGRPGLRARLRHRASGRGLRETLRGHGPGMWRRGLLLAAVALALGAAFALHAEVPNAVGNLGSLWETFLPWGGLLLPLLLAGALLRRSATALVALLVPTADLAEPLRRPARRQDRHRAAT